MACQTGASLPLWGHEVTNTGSEIAPSWLPMRLKILHWRPEFYNWSPVGDQLFRRDHRRNHHCKIYINFDFQPKQLQIKFTYSLQQLTFYLNAASAIKWKGISCVTLSYDNHTAYDRSESCRHFSAVSHYIRIAGAQANHVREIWHVCGLVRATW